MKPEAADYLEKARGDLADAHKVVDIGLAAVAARLAYYAAFHAAEAVIVERSDKVVKTHAGVRAEFARLSRNESDAARDMLTYLARAYAYKQLCDYAVGSDAVLGIEQAREAIDGANRFIARVMAMLEQAK